MSRPIDTVLDRLASFGVKPSGRDRWRACCPAHGGKNRSALSVGVGADDAVLIRCWSGCEVDSIAQALGLELAELFPPRLEAGHGVSRPRRIGLMTAGQAIDLIRSEMNIVWNTLAGLKSGHDITDADLDRAVAALDRVEHACEGFAQ